MNYSTTMQFIELFHRFRALWDKTDNDYLNKDVRTRQRKMIGQRMGMTEVDVGKKICNLRTYYIREMVKRDKAVMQGVATLETYSSKWPYFDALDVFLGGVVQKRRYESLMSCGGRHDNMYIEDHHSDTDNDMSNLCRVDDNDQSREVAGSSGGDNSFVHASPGDNSREGQEGPPLKRAKVEPWSDTDPSSCFADVCDNNSISGGGGGIQQELRGAANNSPMSSTASHPSLPLGGSAIIPAHGSSRVGGSREQLATIRSTVSATTHSMVKISAGTHMRGGFGAGSGGGGSGGEKGTVCVSGTTSGGGIAPGSMMMAAATEEEDDDWLFGRYLVRELKKVKDFKEKQLAKMKMQQIVTYAQLGMSAQSSDTDVTNT